MQAVGHLSLHSLIIPEFFIDFYDQVCVHEFILGASRSFDQMRRMKQITIEREILLEILLLRNYGRSHWSKDF